MKYNIAKLLCILLCSLHGPTHAQDNQHINAFFNDALGRPIKLKQEFNVEGSPYYHDDYCEADIYLISGKKYSNIKTKLNLAENQVLFIDTSGNEMETLLPVKKIHFYNCVLHNAAKQEAILTTFGQSVNTKGSEIGELLVDSTAKLIKKFSITYIDAKKYGEASLTRTYSRNESLLAYIPAKGQDLIKVQKSRTAIVELLKDKADKVNRYIDELKLKCKTEKEIIQVFQYYNSL